MKWGEKPEGDDIVRIETKVPGEGGYYHVYLYARQLPGDFFEVLSIPHQGNAACAGDIVEAEYGNRPGAESDIWVLGDVVCRKTYPVTLVYGGEGDAERIMTETGRGLVDEGWRSEQPWPPVLVVAVPVALSHLEAVEKLMAACKQSEIEVTCEADSFEEPLQ